MSDRSRPFRFSVRRPLAVVACFGLVGALGACGSSGGGSAAPGVTDTTITLGTHQPLTGPAAAGYSSIAPATKAYFDYVNDKGGVNGRKIKYLIKDDGYNPANTQKVVRELVLKDKVFAILNGLGTPTHTGVLGFLKTNKVPDLFVASGSRSWNQPTKYPDTFGLPAGLHDRDEDLRHVHQEELPRQEGLLLRPGRRLRRRRAQGSGDRAGRERGHRGPEVRRHEHQRGPADRQAEERRLRGGPAGDRARLHRAGRLPPRRRSTSSRSG